MGLISFVKNAGAKLFGKKKPKKETQVEQAPEVTEAEREAQKALELENLVRGLGLDINDLYVQVDDDVATIHGNTESLAEKEKAVLAIGNVDGIAQVNDQIDLIATVAQPTEDEAREATVQAQASTYHTVAKGESLSKISKKYYGDYMKYPIIFEDNRPMLKDPNLIYPGQVLRIPSLA